MTNNIKTMYVEPCAGLGNRLLALGSAIYWAKKMNYHLVVLWKKETACCVNWNSIFEESREFEVKELNQMPKAVDNFLEVTSANLYLNRIKRSAFLLECDEVAQLWEKDRVVFEKKLEEALGNIYIKSYGQFAPDSEMNGAIRNIEFAASIINRVNDIMQGKNNVYGIHIRRTDHIEAIEHSTTLKYEKKMSEALRYDENCEFYIASDDQREIDELNKKYRCISHLNYSDIISRESNDGMKDAVVDMLCLSRCIKIFGAYGSTFSKLASIIGNIPLEVIT